MTVINIRGTSGSGKSFIAYRLMNHFKRREDIKQTFAGRERIVGVRLETPGRHNLVLAGRYSTTCGGCDCLSWKGAAEDIMGLVAKWSIKSDVLLEGLMVSSWAASRLLTLCDNYNTTLIQLTTPLEDCLKAVQDRRNERATKVGRKAEPLNPKNTTIKWKQVVTQGNVLKTLGARIEFLDREDAYRRCCELLKLQRIGK
jgi:ABC-type dipeptide/oligopeptide/nickel transport system ATPase component